MRKKGEVPTATVTLRMPVQQVAALKAHARDLAVKQARDVYFTDLIRKATTAQYASVFQMSR